MVSMMLTNCSSSTASHVIHHSNHLNCVSLPRRSVDQLCFKPIALRRDDQLCLQTNTLRRVDQPFLRSTATKRVDQLFLRSTATKRVDQLFLRNKEPQSLEELFLPKTKPQFVDQLCLRTTASGHGCIRSSFDGAMVIDQHEVAGKIFIENQTEVSRMEKSIGAVPGLAVIQVGGRLNKTHEFCCRWVGIKPFVVHLAENSSEEEVLKYVSRFNNDPCVHGIHVQSPLPSHMDEQKILNAISIEKDVDGVHPQHVGRLAMQGTGPIFAPLVPKACIELMRSHNFEISGKRAVVLGRSYRFGMPVALLLQREDATVTIIHSKTKNPKEITRQADIIIAAVGQPNMIRGSWIKPGAFVINIGTITVIDRNARFGLRHIGDVCYEEVCKVASAITSNEYDGIELLIIDAMRQSNVLASAKRFHNFI